MDLQILLARAQEIEGAIINAAAQLNALHGHKAETAHWIQKLEHPQTDATQVEPEVESVVQQ